MSTPDESADTSPLPPPDPSGRRDPEPLVAIQGRPGDLTPSWRMLLGLAWALAFFAYAAIWNASVQIGIGTWWVGPRAQPTFLLIKLLPFLLCLTVLLCIVYNAPRLVSISAVATGFAAVGAIPDFSRSVGLGIAEMTVAALLAIVTATALTGRYRQVPAQDPADALPPPAVTPPLP